MPNRYGDNPDPDNPNPDFNQDFNHPQAAITNCTLLRPLSAGIAALVAEAERLHGRSAGGSESCVMP